MDHLKHLTDIKDAKKSVRLLLSKLPFKPKLTVDIGAGQGEIALALALSGFKVVALEPSSTERLAIRKLIEKYPKAKKNIKIVDGVAEKLPFSDNSVELCILSQVLEHVKSPQRAIGEIARILKPGGYLYLSSPNYLFPAEQHLHIHYFPLMNKSLLLKWATFLHRPKSSKTLSFIENINYTTNPMILELCSKYKLKKVWSASDDARDLLFQVRRHWKQNPSLGKVLFILISLPKKLIRSILANLGILPMKLEYLIQKKRK